MWGDRGEQKKRGRREGGRDRGEINMALLGVQYYKLQIKVAC